jgi:hypothetical protein
MSDIKVRVGQQNAIKVLASLSGGAAFSENSGTSVNVIGGIASVTQLNVSGITTLGITSTTNLTSQQLNVSGITTLGVTSTKNLTSQQLNVSGITTLGVTSTTNLTSQQLNVSGISTLGVTSTTNLTSQQLNVSGISTFVGVATFRNDVYIDGDLYIRDDLRFDEFTARNANITGIATVSSAFYYGQYNTGGVAYFDSTGLMVSTGSTSSAINYTNYILTTDNVGITTWSSTIDGGEY